MIAPALLGAATRFATGPFIRDDAYVALRYAANLAAGQGFVFNRGEPVLGTGAPLLVVLLGGLARLGIEPTAGALVIGLAADLAAMFVLCRIAAGFLPRLGVLLVGLTYALLSPLVFQAVSGSEIPLYMLLVLSTILAYSHGRMASCGLLAGLAALTRPDGAVLVVLLGLHAVARKQRAGWRMAGAFVVAAIAWVPFAAAYFGSPLPQPAPAGQPLAPGGPLALARELELYFLDTSDRWLLPLVPVFLLGLLRRWWSPAATLLMLWAAAYTGAYLAAGACGLSGRPAEGCFVPLLAPFVLGVGAGLYRIEAIITMPSSRLPLTVSVTRARLVTGAEVALVLLVVYGSVWSYEREELTKQMGGREEKYVQVARRLGELGIRNEVVAGFETGAFAYYYPGPVLDLAGRLSPRVTGADAAGRPYSLRPTSAGAPEVLQAVRPPWIMSYLDMLPPEVQEAAWFRQEYRPVYAVGTWEGRRVTLFRRYVVEGAPVVVGLDLPVGLGDDIELVGLAARTEPIEGQKSLIHVSLAWRAQRAPDRRLTFFVHLRDGENRPLAQQDGEPQGNTYPTDQWKAGETVGDQRELVVESSKLDGAAVLVIGAYETGQVNPFRHIPWASPTDAQVPHELRVPLSSFGAAP